MQTIMKSYFMPMPSNLYYWWNFGSLLGFCLVLQITTGLFLSMFYENNMSGSFDSISQIERNINLGWLLRSLHANGASLFFVLIYLHLGRGLYFKSFLLTKVWMSGIILLFLLFMIAFIGYVLPWGQMSFWGATVITNLLTSIPYAGKTMTIWLWGGFSIEKATLMRFFSLHFLLPFILSAMIIIHILFLHESGSNNPLGHNSNMDKIPFQPYFIWKDIMGLMMCVSIFLIIVLIFPYSLMDPDNFNPANPMVTPPHIQPEWYFLFAYAILRTIPNKLGGVIALMMAILILSFLPFLKTNNIKINNMTNKMLFKMVFFMWMNNFLFLTTMGAMPIETPFDTISLLSSSIYFFLYMMFI
uniref:Cytochrome b n=1 Tax=Euseius sacchari TaxID=3061191 RepID=A0AAU6PCN9_9ACAR